MKPMYIVVEGPDGVGKTTFAKELTKNLAIKGKQVQFEYEPTRRHAPGIQIRESFVSPNGRLPTDQLIRLFNQDRALNYPYFEELLKTSTIVSDRNYISSIAMQVDGTFEGADKAGIEYKNLFQPDLIIYLKAPLEVCRARILSNRGVFDNMEDYDYQKTVHANYEKFFSQVDQNGLLHVPGINTSIHVEVFDTETDAVRLDFKEAFKAYANYLEKYYEQDRRS